MPKHAPPVFVYIRWSTDEQSSGDSERRQITLAREYASNHKLTLTDDNIIKDAGLSAFTGENVTRGRLGSFIKDVKANNVPKGSMLIVENLDRLSRQGINESMDLLRTFMRHGIDVHTISDNRIYAAKDFGIIEHMLGGMQSYLSNLESAKKQERLVEVWKKKRADATSGPITALCPKWLRLSRDRKSFEVIPERAAIVKSIFDDSASGIGAHTITKRLNAKHVTPFGKPWKSKTGAARGWQIAAVKQILHNRFVFGEFQPHRMLDGKRVPDGDPIPNYFPAIIDESLFNRAQQSRRQRFTNGGNHGGGRKGANINNLFAGRCSCAYCGAPVQYVNKSSGTYLSCTAARRGLGCRITTGWNYHDFEKSFLAFVSELDLVSILNADASARTNLEREIASLKGKLVSIDERMEQTYKLLEQAPTFIGKKLHDLEQERVATIGLIEEKEKEVALLSSATISKDALHAAIQRLQSGDDNYNLRAEVASQLREIVSSLFVASVGMAPLNKIARDANDEDDVIQYIAAAPETGRFFSVKFKDGNVRNVAPNLDDPLDYTEMVSTADGEQGTLPINLDSFHALLGTTIN